MALESHHCDTSYWSPNITDPCHIVVHVTWSLSSMSRDHCRVIYCCRSKWSFSPDLSYFRYQMTLKNVSWTVLLEFFVDLFVNQIISNWWNIAVVIDNKCHVYWRGISDYWSANVNYLHWSARKPRWWRWLCSPDMMSWSDSCLCWRLSGVSSQCNGHLAGN